MSHGNRETGRKKRCVLEGVIGIGSGVNNVSRLDITV